MIRLTDLRFLGGKTIQTRLYIFEFLLRKTCTFHAEIAKTKSNVLFTKPDGTTGKLNAEEYASQYVDLAQQGYEFDFSELRYSIGVGVTWITALGPLSFALASVFNDSPEDRTETFQFEIGTQF